MRTWNGLVDLVRGDEVLRTVHADLAVRAAGDEVRWWGQLRGTAGLDLHGGDEVTLRLPGGQEGRVVLEPEDPHDAYHRLDIVGAGEPPF